jgi:hypothetical protein
MWFLLFQLFDYANDLFFVGDIVVNASYNIYVYINIYIQYIYIYSDPKIDRKVTTPKMVVEFLLIYQISIFCIGCVFPKII